jgi:Kef-type K+ transport system membrane component KefB
MHVDAMLLAIIAILIGFAKIFGDVFDRWKLPPVLGELTAGIVIGNVHLLGWHGLDSVPRDPQLALLAEIGVVLLLFQVGLESNLHQMAKVGASAFAVASIGVVVPMALGFGVHALLVPDVSWHGHLFVGAVLSATSVGITARVFKDLGHVDSPTGRVVLGAAVIDDVLGLIVLAVVAGVVAGANRGVAIDPVGIAVIVVKAVGFLGAAIVLGRPISRRLYRIASVLRVRGVLLAASLMFCFAIAYLADVVGLAPIVGAFAAGLVLDEVVYRDLAAREDRPLETQLAPLAELLTPIFFVITGAQVDLAAFADVDALSMAAALTLAAVLGKQACALVAFGPGVDRVSVGIGMIPRGEVGLIFAATGAQLVLNGAPVVPPSAYGAIVIMVMATSMFTPPLLARSLRRGHLQRASYDEFRATKQPVNLAPARSQSEVRAQ